MPTTSRSRNNAARAPVAWREPRDHARAPPVRWHRAARAPSRPASRAGNAGTRAPPRSRPVRVRVRHGIAHVGRTAGHASQGRAMRRTVQRTSEIARQRTHIRATGAGDAHAHAIGMLFEQFPAVHGHHHRLQHHVITASREVICALAIDVLRGECGRDLREAAPSARRTPPTTRPAREARPRARPPRSRRRCRSRCRIAPRPHRPLARRRGTAAAGCTPHRHDQQSGGEWVERAGVPNAPCARRAADHADDIVRGHASRLVDEQQPAHAPITRCCPTPARAEPAPAAARSAWRARCSRRP